MINIVLIEPEIPQNTGNIARTCTAIGANLHIVRPIPFDISDKAIKRSGLDYWQYLKLYEYDSLANFIEQHGDNHLYFLTTKTDKKYTDIKYENDAWLVFGAESRGLPEMLMFGEKGKNDDKYYPHLKNIQRAKNSTAIIIPMVDNIRSLNLSNAVAIVAYEVVRQLGL